MTGREEHNLLNGKALERPAVVGCAVLDEFRSANSRLLVWPDTPYQRTDENKLNDETGSGSKNGFAKDREILAGGFQIGREQAAEHHYGDSSDPRCESPYLEPNGNCDLGQAG